MPYHFVKSRRFFLQYLFESVCHTELSVHNHFMTVPYPETLGLHNIFMPACGHGTEVMFVIVNVLRRHLLREVPLRRLRESLYDGIRSLSRQKQQHNQNA